MAVQLNSIRERVRAFCGENGLLEGVTRLRIGFSGGADSTLLTVLMPDLFPVHQAVHFHHGLRGADADTDAAWCRAFCAERGIPFVCVDLDVPGRKVANEGIEAAARRLRLDYWETTTRDSEAVALGHHADDCMEDLLLRLTRGANTGGLTALRAQRILRGVRVLRPLLGLRRSEIEAALIDAGIPDWRHDTSNRDIAIRRNAVRHQWLPLIRQTVGHDQGLLRSLEALRADADCLDELAADAVAAVDSAESLRALHPALLPRVLRLWLHQQLGEDTILPRETILRVRDELARFHGVPVRIPLSANLMACLAEDGIRLLLERPPVQTRTWRWRQSPRLHLPELQATFVAEPVHDVEPAIRTPDPDAEVFDAQAVAETLCVRAWRHGDRLVPFARHSPVKLQDLFTDVKVPREERQRIPLLISGQEIVWVPKVKRAEFGRVGRHCAAVRFRLVRGAENDQ